MNKLLIASTALLASCASAPPAAPPLARTSAEIVETAKADDWRPIKPENTLYLDLPGGRVIIELAPAFAPNHVANIKALAREHYYDGLAIIRAQDNYVVQWGDPAEGDAKARPIKAAKASLPPEFVRKVGDDLPYKKLPDADVYADDAGFAGDFPAARDGKGNIWMAHCYGTVGVGRGMEVNSGSGAQLYAVIGSAPRHLDRNITVVGRVVQGMELLSALPRGKGQLGFYTDPRQYVPIKSARMAADVPDRASLEILRTDTETFTAYLEARRNRREQFFVQPAGHIDVCNVPLPVREVSQ